MGVRKSLGEKFSARSFWTDEGGDAAVQYALVASLVSAFLIGAYLTLGASQNVAYEKWTTAVSEANSGVE
jgi:Flp pilus assembly pilin Flp